MLIVTRVILIEVRVIIATRHATSLQTPPTPTCPCGRSPQGRGNPIGCAHMVDLRWAGKSSRKPRRPRPYSRAFAGISLRSECRPLRPRHAHTMPYTETCGFYNDAARRVATVFEKWNFLIETDLCARSENPPELNPYGLFAAVSPLEHGGLKPILPFLGGRSDAARRVGIWPSRLPPMGAYGLYHAPLVREGTRSARHLPYRDPH